MSFPKLISRASSLFFYTKELECAHLRRYHNSSDFQYQQIWESRGVDFRASLEAPQNFYQSPKLVQRIVQTMAVSKMQGAVPFVHAAPASLRVLMKGLEVLYGKSNGFRYLRSPNGEWGSRSAEQACQDIETPSQEQKSGLLSMSYALASSNRRLEGAAAWGFVNHYGNEQYFFVANLWEEFLKELGMRCDPRALAYFEAQGRNLIRKYNRLKVGDFYVIQVPAAKIDRYVYDSAPFNVPTGKSALDVASDPGAHIDTLEQNRTHMATMLLCDETLSPESGIEIVCANNPDEVQMFCANADLGSVNESFPGYISPQTTPFEEDEEQSRAVADAELEKLAEEFQQYLDTGELVTRPVEEELISSDFPADLP